MKLPRWLCLFQPTVCRAEIQQLEHAIAENDKAIEGTTPIVAEAVKQTDDGIYRLRTKAGVAARRVAHERLVRDLSDGWGRSHG